MVWWRCKLEMSEQLVSCGSSLSDCLNALPLQLTSQACGILSSQSSSSCLRPLRCRNQGI